MNQEEMLSYVLKNKNARILKTHFSDGVITESIDDSLSWEVIVFKNNCLVFEKSGAIFKVIYGSKAKFKVIK